MARASLALVALAGCTMPLVDSLQQPGRLILLRHGQSSWNLENRFTGWEVRPGSRPPPDTEKYAAPTDQPPPPPTPPRTPQDVPLTAKGEDEAREASELLLAEIDQIDACYTSVLGRAISTANICLEGWVADGRHELPPLRTRWRLNERHYGALQGLDKAEATRTMSGSDLRDWRLSFGGAPPPMTPDHAFYSRAPARLAAMRAANQIGGDSGAGEALEECDVPLTESLADAVSRVRPLWEGELLPNVLSGQNLLVVGHANGLRALISCIQVTTEACWGVGVGVGPHLTAHRTSTHPTARSTSQHTTHNTSRATSVTRSSPYSVCPTRCLWCTTWRRMGRPYDAWRAGATCLRLRPTTWGRHAWCSTDSTSMAREGWTRRRWRRSRRPWRRSRVGWRGRALTPSMATEMGEW